MRIRHSVCAALAATTILSGCTSYRGSERLHIERRAKSAAVTQFYGVRQIFIADLERALADRGLSRNYLAAPGANNITVDVNKAKPTDPVAMERLLNSGFSLIRLYCNEYFNEMGRNQRNSAILRDLIKPVTDAVNLVIGLKLLSDKENVNADLVTGFAGFSSAASSGLSIYDRHFLFDNDNIAAVRTMTMKALADNREAAYARMPNDVVLAVGQLQENENICTPAQILSNVREQIKEGEFQTTATGGEGKPTTTTNPSDLSNGKGQTSTSKAPNGSEVLTTSPVG